MDDLAVLLEHVNLLDGRNRLSIDLLEGVGELGLFAGRVLASLLDLSADGTFATNAGLGLELGQFLSVNPSGKEDGIREEHGMRGGLYIITCVK